MGIVRVSGFDLAAIVEGIVGRPLPARTATLATFRDARGGPIDVGLALLFPATASYTGETVLELHGHGSPAALERLLARCLELGARLAQPGEFTRRAFENGRIDLAQAESVADLIEATTATAARAAARSLVGEFSREVRAIVASVTELRTFVEAALDFPDEDLEFVRASDARGRLADVRARLDALTARAATGARLARDDVAIVTPIPGTTRDAVVRPVEIGGFPLTVVDTAGLRATDDPVERLGIERTQRAVAGADAAIVLVDARESGDGLADEDRAVLAQLPAALPRIVVHNKADLTAHAAAGASTRIGGTAHLWLSALTGEGVDALEREILAIAGVAAADEDAFIARARHLEALRTAAGHLDAASRHLALEAPPLELYAEELREAQVALGAITGEFTADDLLGEIFSRFCIGK